MRKITIAILALIVIGMLIPVGFSADSNVVITYGETTYANSNYKSVVDSFFKSQSNLDLNNVGSKIITADQVNQISSSITGKSYDSSQILSSALVNLNDNEKLQVSVDKSKITTITGDMYISALKSAGITKGHVYVTSPVEATGESALAGIMNSYEEVTDVKIPEKVKEAANDEIYTQAKIVNNSDVNADDLSKLVSDVKDQVSRDNVTDHNSIEQVQNVQGDVNIYKEKVSGIFNETGNGGFSLDGILNWFKSFIGQI